MKKIKFANKEVVPSKVVCIGRNYVEHIKELGNEIPENMVVFNKPNSAITNKLEYFSEDTRFEGEICFLIESGEIKGVGFGLDLTKANIQNKMKEKGLPWERAKGFNNSGVLSDFIPYTQKCEKLSMELYQNDTLVQIANYDLMIYKPADIVDEIKSFMELEDGDIIMSGTPKGVGNYSKGDKFIGRVFEDQDLLVEVKWEAV
ncbi:MAG: fumarylacetoacetate hydrolase family protein [Campylobacterales bacterium]|nr:fumarylacetoacetate hydrolase family protein [Campylobacterales bacterium]